MWGWAGRPGRSGIGVGGMAGDRSGAGLLTEHGLEAHEAADEAVEVQGQVGLGVAGDEQLVQLLAEPVPWEGGTPWGSAGGPPGRGGVCAPGGAPGVTCGLQRQAQLVGADGAGLVQVELAEDALAGTAPPKEQGSLVRRDPHSTLKTPPRRGSPTRKDPKIFTPQPNPSHCTPTPPRKGGIKGGGLL